MRNNDIRTENKISLLRLLYRKNQSRIGLAGQLGLSKSAVTGLIMELEERGLVKEIGRGSSSEVGGKRPVILSVNHEAGLFFAIHFNDAEGGVALTDLRGEILHSRPFTPVIADDPQRTLEGIAGIAKEFLAEHRALTAARPVIACGVSMKGLVDSEQGILQYTSSNPLWSGVPVGEYLSRTLGLTTFADNDARAVMCLDMFSRPDEQMDVVGCLCLERGVGTSVFIGNNVLRGAFFGATNIGHTTVDPQGPLCRCGKRGCLEAHISMDALLGKARALPGREGINYEELVRLSQAGAADIRQLLTEDYCRWVGIGAANFIGIFNPRRLTVYLDLQLFDEELRNAIIGYVHEYENQVMAKSQVRFSSNGLMLHLRAAAALAIKNFLSVSYHDRLVKGA